MATCSHARAVKSLNKGTGGRRFVFKSCSRRIEEIEIDLFRSLNKIDSSPKDGSSFLKDCLVEWRELNTAEDFISLYEELLPVVQTLPLVLINKELILSKILSGLKMEARLSLEPILRLIAALSRDLLEDFLAFIPKIVDTVVVLLTNGGDKDPEIVEQVCLSWSYILMYLHKYLVRDISKALKFTAKLRYYKKSYIQELMIASTSFLLRNASSNQLVKGIKKLLHELMKNPSDTRRYGVCLMLYYAMKGTSLRLHSKAEQVLQVLTDNTTIIAFEEFERGSSNITEVVLDVFEKLKQDLTLDEIITVSNSLITKIENSLSVKSSPNLNHLIAILTKVITLKRADAVVDHQPILRCVEQLIKHVSTSEVVGEVGINADSANKTLNLILAIIDFFNQSSHESAISHCVTLWAPVIDLKSSSAFPITFVKAFLRELLQKDYRTLYLCRANILRSIFSLGDIENEEAMYLLLITCKRAEESSDAGFFLGAPETVKLGHFIEASVSSGCQLINSVLLDEKPSQLDFSKLAMLWGSIHVYRHVLSTKCVMPMLIDAISAIKKVLMKELDIIAGIDRCTWQCLLGSALRCLKYSNVVSAKESREVLLLAEANKLSSHVLSSAVDYLDVMMTDVEDKSANIIVDKKTLYCFLDNLFNPSKELRIQTLKIMRHVKPLVTDTSNDVKMNSSEIISSAREVLQIITEIEATPFSVTTSRSVVLLISKIQMIITSGSTNETYAPIVMCGLLGLLQNRYSCFWDAVSECLAIVINKYHSTLWDKYFYYFELCLSAVCSSHSAGINNDKSISKSEDLVGLFKSFMESSSDSNPCSTILALLLQNLQRIPAVAEAHSRQLVPCFFRFLNLNIEYTGSLDTFLPDHCNREEVRRILKEWLNLLKLFRNPKALYKSQDLKDALQYSLLDNKDPYIQVKVLETLLSWKDDFLVPYERNLRNLIQPKVLREELVSWSLTTESAFINEVHRDRLIPIVLIILMPKVRSLKSLASRKHASINLRKAVLRFVAQLPVHEISLFFTLLVKSLLMAKEADGVSTNHLTLPKLSLGEVGMKDLLLYLPSERILAIPVKMKYGFLHVVEEVLLTFSEEQIKPYLDLLILITMRILERCSVFIEAAHNLETANRSTDEPGTNSFGGTDETEKQEFTSCQLNQAKDLRSVCLKIVSFSLNRYDDHPYSSECWDLFFKATKPFIGKIKQQASSSEQPGVLLSCFLAMSRSIHLVHLLFQDACLIFEIFSILTVTSASESVVSCIILLIINLLNLDQEINSNNNGNAERIICSAHIEAIINSLHFLHIECKRKFVKCEGVSYMATFKILSLYMTNAELAGKLLDILLRVLSLKKKDQDDCVECLQIIVDILPFLAPNDMSKILDAVSKLFITSAIEMRLHLCKILQLLAETDSSILPVAKLVVDLNATSALEDDNMDYETIVNAYTKIESGFFGSVNHDQALIVLSQFIHDMSSQNLGIRGYALHSLINFVEFSALILQEKEDPDEVGKQHCWTKASVINILMKFLLKHVGNAMKDGNVIKQEWFDLLRKMVVKLPELSSLHSCEVLCSDDVEQDFFYNIAHQQKHRRSRSILRFNAIATANPVSQDILKQIFLPLFLGIIYDTQSDKNDNVKNASLEAVSVIAAYMDWRSYNDLLNVCVREMSHDSKKHRILARLLSSILDKFKYSWLDTSEEVTGVTTSKAFEIRKQLKDILKKVQKLLESDSEKIDAFLNLVAIKILKLLPNEEMDLYLSSIIHNIVKRLKNRSERMRDDARSSLAQCLKELGPEYLAFVINILQAVLKRGYELHVLGYTLHFLLSSLSRSCSTLKLDYCLNELLKAVEIDILGDVAEEKEVENIAKKMKETKKVKSFETLEIIARSITLKNNAQKLLSVVTSQFQNTVSPDLSQKLQKMLNHISEGLESNQSLSQEDLLIFVYCLIEEGVNHEFGLKDDLAFSSNAKSPSSYLITEFALHLFLKYVKSTKCDKNDEKIISMLDPFLPWLACCLKSKYEGVLVATLRILVPLVKFPLPSLVNEADKIKLTLLDISHSCLNSNTSLMQSCLRLLTDLLKSTKIKLSADHLRMIIQLPLFTDLERNPSFAALSLLRAIVKRKLIVSEMYDIMRSVGELMITSQLEPMRRKCSSIMLQFLLDYRLSQSYMQQYLDFLVKNLSYEHPSGRESVLEMLNVIISKFPLSFLTKHSHTLFIHLVQRLANDDSSRVRSMTGAVIKLLLNKIQSNVRNSIVEISLSWYLDGTSQLKCIGAQALGFLVEVMGKAFAKHMDPLYQVISKVLQCNNSWKEVYYTLILLEKAFQSGCVACLRYDLKDVWGILCKLPLHEHAWVQNTSNRLLAMYFAATKNAETKKDEEMLFLLNPNKLMFIISSLCNLMKSPDLDDSTVSLLIQNIAFSMCTLNSCVETELPRIDEQGELLKSLEALDHKKGKKICIYLASNGHEFHRFFISNLIGIIGKIAFSMDTLQMKIVFSIFKLMITKGCVEYANVMLVPLYKASEGYSGKVISDDVKVLAQEICGVLRDTMGINKFAEVYTEVQKKMKMKRDKRRQDDKAMAVVHPERMAKRKLRLSEKNRSRKRRKIMAAKFGRWKIGG